MRPRTQLEPFLALLMSLFTRIRPLRFLVAEARFAFESRKSLRDPRRDAGAFWAPDIPAQHCAVRGALPICKGHEFWRLDRELPSEPHAGHGEKGPISGRCTCRETLTECRPPMGAAITIPRPVVLRKAR